MSETIYCQDVDPTLETHELRKQMRHVSLARFWDKGCKGRYYQLKEAIRIQELRDAGASTEQIDSWYQSEEGQRIFRNLFPD